MSIRLSINLNKVALLRNSRENDCPNILDFVDMAVRSGANGITLHPRPDGRHARPDDLFAVKGHLEKFHPHVELNVEGNPYSVTFGSSEKLYETLFRLRPDQFTLVPDSEGQLTSDHGWNIGGHRNFLSKVIGGAKQCGIRTSVFMDHFSDEWALVKECGADAVELYTQEYAEAYGTPEKDGILEKYFVAAKNAVTSGLSVHAGHDLNQVNLGEILKLDSLKEVSIGHAIMVEGLHDGFSKTVANYKEIIDRHDP